WCFVNHSGPDGWVSANYLSPSGDYAPPPPPVYYQPEPEYVPAPVFINPPIYYDRRDFRRHYPHRHPGTPFPPGSSPPPTGAKPPPPALHQQFPPGYGRQFRSQPSGKAPSSRDICITDPSAPICSSGGSGSRR